MLGTLAIILVLFEGGLELVLRRTLQHFPGSLLLSVLAYGFSITLVGLIVHKGLGLPVTTALAVGAVVGCTSSTVVLPVLQQLQSREPVKVTLILEASWGDVLAVLTVGLLLGAGSQGGAVAGHVLQGVLTQVGVAIVFATAAGILWSRLLPALSGRAVLAGDDILDCACALCRNGGLGRGSRTDRGAGFRADAGELSWNRSAVSRRGRGVDILQSQESLLSFHSELAFLVRTFFFVLIGAIADLRSFRGHTLLMAGMLGALFVARWLALQVSRLAFRDISAKERELMLWIMPAWSDHGGAGLASCRGTQGSQLPFCAGLRCDPGDERDGGVGSLRASRDAVATATPAKDGTAAEITQALTGQGTGCCGGGRSGVQAMDIGRHDAGSIRAERVHPVVRQPASRAASP